METPSSVGQRVAAPLARSSSWYFVLAVLGLLLYHRALAAPLFDDDYWFLFGETPHSLFYWFAHKNPFSPVMYRPIEALMYGGFQRLFGSENVVPGHLFNLVGHIGLSGMVYAFMAEAGFSRVQAASGSLFLLFGQANVYAVASNDTLSQVWGTLAGTASVWLTWRAGFADSRPSRTLLGWAVLAFGLALFLKETSAGFGIVIAAILLKAALDRHPPSQAVKVAALRVAPFVIVGAGYLVIRRNLGLMIPEVGDGYWNIKFGSNLLRNAAVFVGNTVLPVGSMTVYAAWRNATYATIVAAGVLTLGWLAVVGFGVWRVGHRRALLALGAIALVAQFPILLMHFSELYLYNSMPFLAVIVGAGLGWVMVNGPVRIRQLALLVGVATLIGQAEGVWRKTEMVNRNGIRAQTLLAGVINEVRQAPRDGTVILLQPADAEATVSIYVQEGFMPIRNAVFGHIPKRAGRDDVTIRLTGSQLTDPNQAPPGSVFLMVSHDSVTRVDAQRVRSNR